MRPLGAPKQLQLLVAAAVALVVTAVFVATGAAATQDIGGYTVTDSVTQDAGSNTTTATYTIFRPSGAKGLGQVNVGLEGCWTNQTISSISHSGSYVAGQDPSTKQAGPLIRWTSDLGAKSGETVTESYTVQGLYDATGATEKLGIKSGGDFSTGNVAGIGCTPSSTGGNGGNGGNTGNTGSTGNNGSGVNGTVGGQQGVAGIRVALPAAGRSCTDTRKFTFRLHHAASQPVVDVLVFVNGRQKAHKHGASISKVTVKRLPQGRFTLKVVATQQSGSKLTSIRKYNGCKKSKPRTTGHHVNGH